MDGSALDAVLCAVVTALTDLQLPCLKVSRQEDDESEFEEKQIQILEQVSFTRQANLHDSIFRNITSVSLPIQLLPHSL